MDKKKKAQEVDPLEDYDVYLNIVFEEDDDDDSTVIIINEYPES